MAIKKLPGGVEDLTFGMDTESQYRKDRTVTITQINGSHIPYDRTYTINQKINVHTHDVRYYQRSKFLDNSQGAIDAGQPVKLGPNGRLDPSITGAGTYMVGPFTPTAGNEYPSVAGEGPGAYWLIEGLDSAGYTYTEGDLIGKTVYNENIIMWGTQSWVVVSGLVDANTYYKLDGSQALTNTFAAGGHLLSNIADGIADTDASSVGQLNTHIADNTNPHQVTADQVGALSLEDGGVVKDTVTIGDGTNGRILNIRAFGAYDAVLILLRSSGTRAGEFRWNSLDDSIVLRKYHGDTGTYFDLQLDDTNNIRVTGGADPVYDSHLVKKGYVDNQDSLLEGQLLGVNQSWQDVTAERQLDIEYVNDTNRPISVAIKGDANGTVGQGLNLEVDGITVAQAVTVDDTYNTTLANGIVPAGSTYKATTNSSIGLLMWNELREIP